MSVFILTCVLLLLLLLVLLFFLHYFNPFSSSSFLLWVEGDGEARVSTRGEGIGTHRGASAREGQSQDNRRREMSRNVAELPTLHQGQQGTLQRGKQVDTFCLCGLHMCGVVAVCGREAHALCDVCKGRREHS